MTNCANQLLLSTPALSFNDVPPQPKLPTDNVFRPDRRPEPTFGPKTRAALASDSLNNRTRVKPNRVFFPADSAKPVPLVVVSPG
ncbi:unnamed protein product, partial [Sphenostylis stenocarpa]